MYQPIYPAPCTLYPVQERLRAVQGANAPVIAQLGGIVMKRNLKLGEVCTCAHVAACEAACAYARVCMCMIYARGCM